MNGALLQTVPGPESINIKITREWKAPPPPLPESHQGANNSKAGDMKPRPPPSRQCASPQLHHAGHKGQARKKNGYPRTDLTYTSSKAWMSCRPPQGITPRTAQQNRKPHTPTTSNNLSPTSPQP